MLEPLERAECIHLEYLPHQIGVGLGKWVTQRTVSRIQLQAVEFAQ